jgi:hypothetical protein
MENAEKIALLVVSTLAQMAKVKLKDEADDWISKLQSLADEGIDTVVEALTTTTMTSKEGVFVDESTNPED